jgi:transposase
MCADRDDHGPPVEFPPSGANSVRADSSLASLEQSLDLSPEHWRQTPAPVRMLLLGLVGELEGAREELAELRKRVEELEERLRTDSHNSSKPPSSDPPQSTRPKRPSGARKQGAQPGHEGKSRPLLPAEEVDEVVDCPPPEQCACGGRVRPSDAEPERRQLFEIPRINVSVTEYRLWAGTCELCGRPCRGALPPGVADGMLGPRAMAIVALLSGKFHLSKRNVEEILSDLFGLQIALGTVSNTEARVAAALEEPVEEARRFVQQQAVAHLDETGWKQRGDRRWLWTAVASGVAVFAIRASRGTKVAVELLGKAFGGIVVSDRWSAYNWLDAARRQLCWAHLKRDFIKIFERGGASAAIGTQLLACTRIVFGLWYRLRDGPLTRPAFQEAIRPIRQRVEALLDQGAHCGHPKTQRTCQNILKLKAALWTFVDVPGVEPTNNTAERAVRPGVQWRRRSFGTQSEQGNRFVESLLTVSTTCRLQARNVLEYLVRAIEAALSGQPAPSLIPVAACAEQPPILHST